MDIAQWVSEEQSLSSSIANKACYYFESESFSCFQGGSASCFHLTKKDIVPSKLTSVTMPGVERQRTFSGGDPKSLGAIGRRRTLSMEEYDMPRPRRLSLTIPQK